MAEAKKQEPATAAAKRVPELLITRSALQKDDKKAAKPGVKPYLDRVFPFPVAEDADTWPKFFQAFQQWIADLEECVATGRVKGQIKGTPVDVEMKIGPACDGTRMLTSLELLKLVQQAFQGPHWFDLRGKLKVLHGIKDASGEAKGKGKDKEFDTGALA